MYRQKRRTSSYAKNRARAKARKVYRQNIRMPKKSIVKKFANFVGKSTFESAKSKRKTGKRYRKRRY